MKQHGTITTQPAYIAHHRATHWFRNTVALTSLAVTRDVPVTLPDIRDVPPAVALTQEEPKKKTTWRRA